MERKSNRSPFAVTASSAKLAGIIIVLWFNWRLISPSVPNPFEPFIFLSHKVPTSSPDDPRYQKGYCDLLFLTFYVIVFSCIRQTTTIYLFKPFAEWWGLRTENKKARFMEQGYAILYWGTAGALGIVSRSTFSSVVYSAEA